MVNIIWKALDYYCFPNTSFLTCIIFVSKSSLEFELLLIQKARIKVLNLYTSGLCDTRSMKQHKQ